MNWLLKLATGNPINLLYIAGAIAVASAGLVGTAAWEIQGWRLDALQARYDGFVAQTRIIGEQAAKAAKAREAADKLNKEKTDASHKTVVARLNADIDRLRAEHRAGQGGLRAPATAPGSPNKSCFNPTKLADALHRLDDGILGLIAEGSRAVIDLDAAKLWGQRISR